jgi:hypothetical protein
VEVPVEPLGAKYSTITLTIKNTNLKLIIKGGGAVPTTTRREVYKTHRQVFISLYKINP